MYYNFKTYAHLPYGLSALDEYSAHLIIDFIFHNKPKTILEFGSGTSTYIFADYAAKSDAQVISLEHIEKYYNETLSLLGPFSKYVDLRLCRIEDQQYVSEKELPLGVDFVLIDGPPAYGGPDHIGREKTFPQIYNYLSSDWHVFLDDAKRKHEYDCLELWKDKYNFHYEYIETEKGLLHLHNKKTPSQLF
jgi:hypothetical protein